jgi:hypothetical protein
LVDCCFVHSVRKEPKVIIQCACREGFLKTMHLPVLYNHLCADLDLPISLYYVHCHLNGEFTTIAQWLSETLSLRAYAKVRYKWTIIVGNSLLVNPIPQSKLCYFTLSKLVIKMFYKTNVMKLYACFFIDYFDHTSKLIPLYN